MNENIREQGVSLKSLAKLALKNIFSVVYFMIAGLIITLVYTLFLVKPNFEATGNIENRGAVATAFMTTITTIAGEDKTISVVVEKLEISEEENASKINEIKKGLTIGLYNASTLKTTITYSGTNKEEVILVTSLIIQTTIDEFVERNPSLVGKVEIQTDPIKATQTGISKSVIYVTGIFLGALVGLIIGVGRDLFNRKIICAADLEEYQIPFSVINLNRKSKEEIMSPEILKGEIPKILEEIEELAKNNKVKILGVTNLGNAQLDDLVNCLGEERNEAGLNSLIIDLNVEADSSINLYEVDSPVNITNVLTNDNVSPIKVKENLDVLPASKYEFPARFLKENKLMEAIKRFKEEYEYVFIKLPTKDFYSAILFNLDLIDALLINVSFEQTEMKVIDKYIGGINKKHHDKIFINAVDSTVKKDYFAIFKRETKDK